MGIFINLYRVGKADNLEGLKELEQEIAASLKVDLYKMTGDLACIFSNSIDPFNDIESISYEILFGTPAVAVVGDRQIGGFIPSSEIKRIVDWIKSRNLDSREGFAAMYEGLSVEVKERLEAMGSPDKDELFNFYVKPLVDFYLAAQKEANSVVVIGE